MKNTLTVLFITFCLNGLFAQNSNPSYDSTLAKQLDADQYGMKMYVLVILKTGKNKTKNKHFIDSCFVGHLENIRRLAELNQLTIAGPFGNNKSDFRGLFILNVKTIEEAQKLLETDPAIKGKLLRVELYPWYGSAAIPTYLENHDKIWKENP